ncbi:MAG TPA: serine hydrolase [Caulobacteraceae bacterium]|nr:serine hydrolase [Caulobacteraceae bacterium]
MPHTRRNALGIVAGATLAACSRPALKTPPRASAQIDVARLDREFPLLAQRAHPGAFAMGLMDLATTQTWYWNTDRAFPLAGAVAAPIAVAAMAEVDAGRLRLDEPVAFNALDLSPPPSLINHNFPTPPDAHKTALPAQSLITLALHEADTTATDVLMSRIGGPGAVSAFLAAKGVTGVRVDRYWREIGVEMFGMPTFRPDWKDPAAFDAARDLVAPAARQSAMNHLILDPRDTATVPAALGFLALLAGGQLVSAGATARLLGWMSNGPPGHFAAGLPAGASVASAGGPEPQDLGFVAAAAELAIVTLPHGRRYALAGFLVASTATEAARRALFADGARLAAAVG